MPSKRFLFVVALLVVCGIVAMIGKNGAKVGLSSLLDLSSDTLRDTDQVGMKLTRLSDSEEMKIGANLARSMSQTEDAAASAYVTDVAKLLLPHTRRHGIRYQFHVTESPEINAFALPGGQVFVTTGLLNFVESEAELAAVVGHEITHVDLRHCVEHYQYEFQLKRVGVPGGLAELAEIAHRLTTMGFSHDQEREADAQGERITIEAGYDPDAASVLFTRMAAHFGERLVPNATTPAGEVTKAMGEAIEAYFRTHPRSEDRAQEMKSLAATAHRRFPGKQFYAGKENLRRRIARSRQEFAGELHATQKPRDAAFAILGLARDGVGVNACFDRGVERHAVHMIEQVLAQAYG